MQEYDLSITNHDAARSGGLTCLEGSSGFYLERDVLRLVEGIPYLPLRSPKSALRFWARLRDDGIELAHLLRQFPFVKYEPLETLYACARAAAVLDEKLVSDLSTHYSWRGVVLVSFLIALRPRAIYEGYLQRAHERVPHNQWIVELALSEIRGSNDDRHIEHRQALRELRGAVANFPKQPVNLRRGPTADELPGLRSATAAVADAYKSSGVQQARAVLNASAWRGFL